MPGFVVATLVTSVLSSATASVFGAVVGRIVAGVIGAVAGSIVSRAVTGKPRAPEAPSIQAQGRLVTVRQAISEWQIVYGQARVGGDLTFAEESTDKQFFHLVVTLAGHECQEIGDVYFDDEVVPLDGSGNATGKYAGYARIKKSLGDEGASQPFPDLVSESDGKWTNSHLQRGRAKLYVRLKANPDLFTTGVPNITAVVKGKKVRDPRTSPTTEAYSNNAALVVADYLANTTFGIGADWGSEIDEATLIAAANECDEQVELAGSPTTYESRYTINGSFRLGAEPQSVLEDMLGTMAGWAVNVGGQWYVFAGAYEAPSITLDEDDLAGGYRVQSVTPRRRNANGVKGVFVDPNQSWQAVDFPAIEGAGYLVEDGNERVWRDVDLTRFCTSGSQAQRLAKIELLRTREGLTFSAPFKLSAYRAMTGRTIALTITKLGWDEKVFEVTSSSFVVSQDGTLGVRLDLRETAAAIYEWSTSDEQAVDLAPNTNLPDPSVAAAPTGLTLTQSSTVWDTLEVSWTAPSNDFLVDKYQVEYRLVEPGSPQDGEWTVMPRVHDPYKEIPRLLARTYQVRVKSINIYGTSSDYTDISEVTVDVPRVNWGGTLTGTGLLRAIGSQSTGSIPNGFEWTPQLNELVVGCLGEFRFHNPVNGKQIDTLTHAYPLRSISSLTYCPTNGKIYCQVEFQKAIIVLDPVNRSIDATITTKGTSGEWGIYCPDDNRIYIGEGTYLAKINPSTDTLEDEIEFGSPSIGTQWGGCYCPSNGLIYWAQNPGNVVTVYDPLAGAVVASIGMSTPHYMAYCPVNDRIYVSQSSASQVSVINPQTNTVVDTISLIVGSPTYGVSPGPVAYAPLPQLIYVLDRTQDEIIAIHPQINEVTSITDAGSTVTGKIIWVPSSNNMFVTNYASPGSFSRFSV